MKHTDFYMMYKAIRDKEVVALKNALQKFPNHQCVGLQKILAMIVAFLLKIWKAEKL